MSVPHNGCYSVHKPCYSSPCTRMAICPWLVVDTLYILRNMLIASLSMLTDQCGPSLEALLRRSVDVGKVYVTRWRPL